MNRRAYVAAGATVLIFLLVQVGALAMVEPFQSAGLQTVEDPRDPTNSLLYLVAILVATGAMLAAFKLGGDAVIRLFIVLSGGLLSYYVFLVLLPPVAVVGGFSGSALVAAGALALALLVYPEWYVIDATGVVMGVGAAALFGISFGLLPALLLLTALAVYDAISVYGTEHMLTLAAGVMDLRVPVVLVVPLTLGYSFLEEEGAARVSDEGATPDGGDAGATPADLDDSANADGGGEDDSEGVDGPDPAERDAFFIGLGDVVMPTILVASAAFFLETPSLGVPGLPTLTLPALTAMIGTIAGLLVLVGMVMRGRAHAGLPLLNGGAIGGYLVGALAAGVPLLRALGI
ncbi:presenilin family intramembrane aspartyl protease PSH [Halomarina halobia]|uniref:Presenilin family intramembrane aspartyl protease PSH n=1 Tax=Halomarina halobia TaxID=3033386 RepID=A0ABD6A6G3_9EURY|nr:presenilin family intramembrane aspartyl protease PSH [Halomarina sp. PSR21]